MSTYLSVRSDLLTAKLIESIPYDIDYKTTLTFTSNRFQTNFKSLVANQPPVTRMYSASIGPLSQGAICFVSVHQVSESLLSLVPDCT